MDWVNSLAPHWLWLIAGMLLATAEIVAPGFFLMWLGAAALVTGLVAALLPISVAVQFGTFTALAIGAVYAARRWFAGNPIVSDDPLLNDRSARMVGQVVTVVDPITPSGGRVKVGDSVWSARGADAAIGAHVRVVGVESGIVSVEAI
jgi:inner membrane protein